MIVLLLWAFKCHSTNTVLEEFQKLRSRICENRPNRGFFEPLRVCAVEAGLCAYKITGLQCFTGFLWLCACNSVLVELCRRHCFCGLTGFLQFLVKYSGCSVIFANLVSYRKFLKICLLCAYKITNVFCCRNVLAHCAYKVQKWACRLGVLSTMVQ
jgi:hypothetical protein